MTAYSRKIIIGARALVSAWGHRLLATDTDSVTFELSKEINSTSAVLDQVKNLNTEIAK